MRGRVDQGGGERAGEADFSAQPPAEEQDARVPGADAWPRRPERPPPQAAAGTAPADPSIREGRHRSLHTPQPRSRLTTRQEFSRVYREGRRYVGELLVLYFLPTETPRRVGVVTSRRLGKAVARNRARRRVREALRHLESRFCARGDVVVVAKPGARSAPFTDILGEMTALCAEGRLLREDA
jgi:ribonuclease P protein component